MSIGVLVGEELERKDDVVIADMGVALVVDKEKVWPEVKRVEPVDSNESSKVLLVRSEFSELQAAAAPISKTTTWRGYRGSIPHKKNK